MIKKRNKLVILGCLDTFADAPFDDDSFEIWGMNYLWRKFEGVENARADVWWEIHTPHTRTDEHLDWLEACQMPVIMQETHLTIPNSVKYPLDEIIKEYGRRYFLCTMNYQIALAMYMGYKEIHMYGFNMILGDDLIQRWSVEYWLGRAEQSGIKIFLPDDCDMLKSPYLYGYEADNTLAVYISKYMGELQNKALSNICDAAIAVHESASALRELFSERPKFMEEIFNRHGLKIVNNEEEDLM